MTKELAKLLDGPVAERFGRPVSEVGAPLVRRYDVWCSDAHAPKYQKSCCVYWEDSHLRYGDGPTAAALWLAHLLGVCGEWGRHTEIWQDSRDQSWGVNFTTIDVPQYGDTLLEALARAMLAVPEVKP